MTFALFHLLRASGDSLTACAIGIDKAPKSAIAPDVPDFEIVKGSCVVIDVLQECHAIFVVVVLHLINFVTDFMDHHRHSGSGLMIAIDRVLVVQSKPITGDPASLYRASV